MDKYYIYRPLLDLIGHAEGTDKGRKYNETLAYGAYTGGDVDLVSLTLAEIDDLQTRMLAHPKNKWNSSAVGRYQIVRTTLRSIKKQLQLSERAKYDEAMQDRLACYLLGVRGIDEYLAGRKSEDEMLVSLAQEWASFPKPNGQGYYSGQGGHLKPAKVRAALAEVRRRKQSGVVEPLKPAPTPMEPAPTKPVSNKVPAVVFFVILGLMALGIYFFG